MNAGNVDALGLPVSHFPGRLIAGAPEFNIRTPAAETGSHEAHGVATERRRERGANVNKSCKG